MVRLARDSNGERQSAIDQRVLITHLVHIRPVFLLAVSVLASCTTSQKINRPVGRVEDLIA